MQTLEFNLGRQWAEVLGGNNAFSMQVKSAGNVELHFNDSDTAPASDAPAVYIESYPPQWDFACQSQTGQARVWARAAGDYAQIVVVRRTV